MPAKFMLVAAMNPCPCGNYGDPSAVCVCSPLAISRYSRRISGPLLDRIDIRVFVSHEKIDLGKCAAEDISRVRRLIANARMAQAERLRSIGLVTNSEISHRTIDDLCVLEPSAERLLASIVNQKSLSLRAYHKIKKIARTIADLEGSERIAEHHIAEALALRITERIT
jgi:magnesium chelatase family protein